VRSAQLLKTNLSHQSVVLGHDIFDIHILTLQQTTQRKEREEQQRYVKMEERGNKRR
jgi:hypothetical protein